MQKNPINQIKFYEEFQITFKNKDIIVAQLSPCYSYLFTQILNNNYQ